MLMIRLARFGGKKKPSYRVVVIDKERARNSRSVEVVGIYSPVATPKAVKLDHARIEHWMKNGAQPSATVARLIKTYPAVSQFWTYGKDKFLAQPVYSRDFPPCKFCE